MKLFNTCNARIIKVQQNEIHTVNVRYNMNLNFKGVYTRKVKSIVKEIEMRA